MAKGKLSTMRMEDIKPYPNNPRRNDGAVDAVVLGASGVFLKLLCEVVLFPATNMACKKIKKAEGVDEFAKKG